MLGFLTKSIAGMNLKAAETSNFSHCSFYFSATYYCYMKYVELKADETVAEDPNNYNIKANLDYYSGLYETWMYTGIVCVSLLGIILLMTCFLCNRIRLAIRVIGEASR